MVKVPERPTSGFPSTTVPKKMGFKAAIVWGAGF